jgi:L-ascorbate metabolism protein UlaG (beta-lactamase superfamily)
MGEVFRWGVTERLIRPRPIDAPGQPAPSVKLDRRLVHGDHPSPRLTWIGHASFLGSLNGSKFLVDPVFSQRVGLVVRRFGRPGLGVGDLPPIDALLVSHCHYDHLDAPSVRALPRATPVVVPRGLGRWFTRRRFTDVTELAWWESAEAGSLRVTLVPACHWSRRRIGDTNRTLWGGFVVEGGGVSVYHSGDSAWFDGFREIGERFPGLLAAMLPIGAYAPAWFMEHHHLNPEQAGRAFLDLGARNLVPMHWGAFKLTDESLVEPARRIRTWWRDNDPRDGRRLQVPAVGQTLVFDDDD